MFRYLAASPVHAKHEAQAEKHGNSEIREAGETRQGPSALQIVEYLNWELPTVFFLDLGLVQFPPLKALLSAKLCHAMASSV